jgi:hypothetical protein
VLATTTAAPITTTDLAYIMIVLVFVEAVLKPIIAEAAETITEDAPILVLAIMIYALTTTMDLAIIL